MKKKILSLLFITGLLSACQMQAMDYSDYLKKITVIANQQNLLPNTKNTLESKTSATANNPQQSPFKKFFEFFNDEPIITTPYQATSLRAQYPILNSFDKVVKTTGLGLSLYFLSSYCKDYIDPSWAGILGLILGYRYIEPKRPPLTDSLLLHPESALTYGYHINDQFGDAVEKKGINDFKNKPFTQKALQETNALISTFEKKWPLFLLGECTAEGWGPCILSRSYQPKNRDTFEQEVVSSLLQKMSNTKPVEYVGFATGGMFQDLVILVKALAQKPNGKINIHLIDKKFTGFAYSKMVIEQSTEIHEHKSIDFSSPTNMDTLKNYAKTHWGAKNETDSNIEKLLKMECIGQEKKCQQMLSYLKKTFPHAQLSLSVYGSAQDYCMATKKTQTYADVISAADMEDEISLVQQSNVHYAALCTKMLKKNPTADNIWLAKNPQKGTAKILKISLSKTQNSIEEKFEPKKNKEITLYLTQKEIE
jgi:hypothetical protein